MDELAGGGATAFEGYVEALTGVIGHVDRAEPLRDCCLGLMMPVARKSVEPLATVTAPAGLGQASVAAPFRGAVAVVRGGSGCLNRLAGPISGLPAGDHAAARSGRSKYTSFGVWPPRLECGRMAL